jgi:uncharacterized surface protein with fasciclin (FAS1) repeats
MRTRSLIAATAIASAGLLVAACGGDDATDTSATTVAAPATTAAPAEATKDIVDTAVAAGGFTTLASALTQAGLVETLKGEGPFTVFAPTDEAFAAVPADTLTALLADSEALTKVLTYHVVPGKVMAADVTTGDVTTVEGSPLPITVTGGTVQVGGATVVTPDVTASNGVIHVIDQVLLPPELEIGGGEAAQPATVVDVIRQPDLAQLGIAINSAGLVDTLKGAGPFTVFAPNNAAFATLGTDTINALNQNPGQLTPILTYHVVPGLVLSQDIRPGKVTTVNGAELDITVENGVVKVNGATVVTPDQQAGNGVVHVIDQVLTPPAA